MRDDRRRTDGPHLKKIKPPAEAKYDRRHRAERDVLWIESQNAIQIERRRLIAVRIPSSPHRRHGVAGDHVEGRDRTHADLKSKGLKTHVIEHDNSRQRQAESPEHFVTPQPSVKFPLLLFREGVKRPAVRVASDVRRTSEVCFGS